MDKLIHIVLNVGEQNEICTFDFFFGRMKFEQYFS